MNYIPAPWREDYVKNVTKQKGCVFCRSLKRGDDRETLILHRGAHNFIILNRYPYTPGHLMIAPYRHLARFDQAPRETTDEMSELIKLCLKVLKKQYRPHGFNTGMNLGTSSGAGVVGHFHFHVIPRWTGDSNFMPLIAGTKVLPEDLATAFARLAPLFRKFSSEPD